jgi:hypothetical protein
MDTTNRMSKSNYQKPSPQTQDEAMKTKDRTTGAAKANRLITQGIQRGIDLYKTAKERRELKKKAQENIAAKGGGVG